MLDVMSFVYKYFVSVDELDAFLKTYKPVFRETEKSKYKCVNNWVQWINDDQDESGMINDGF